LIYDVFATLLQNFVTVLEVLYAFTNGFKLFLERKRTLRILLPVGPTACKFHRTRSLNDYYCLASLRRVRVSEHNYVSYCSPIIILYLHDLY